MVAAAAVLAAMGCGPRALTVDGTVQGRSLDARDAVLMPEYHAFSIQIADHDRLCAVLTAEAPAPERMLRLELWLYGTSQSEINPPPPGVYPGTDGRLLETQGCTRLSTVPASGGTIEVLADGWDPEAQMRVRFDLLFGTERLTGHDTATFCQGVVVPPGGCLP